MIAEFMLALSYYATISAGMSVLLIGAVYLAVMALDFTARARGVQQEFIAFMQAWQAKKTKEGDE